MQTTSTQRRAMGVYEPLSGRLSTMTDAKHQRTRYRYYADDALCTVQYEDADTGVSLERTVEGRKIDAAVTFGYDTKYRRVISMADGTLRQFDYTYGVVGTVDRPSAEP